jgi:DNA-directed RNA polymerase specialized sigma24 family protein
MYSESMEPRDLLAVTQIPDPTERAVAIGVMLGQVSDLQHQLRQARQDAVLQMRTDGMSHADVAAALGVTRSRAQQIAEGKTTTSARKD